MMLNHSRPEVVHASDEKSATMSETDDTELRLCPDKFDLQALGTHTEDFFEINAGLARVKKEQEKGEMRNNIMMPQTSNKFASANVASSSSTRQNLRTAADPASSDRFSIMKQQIESCRTIDDLVTVYLSWDFQSCLARLEAAQLGYDRVEWAQHWAIKLSQNDQGASNLNSDRWLCLRLLYVMCDLWKPKDETSMPATVSEWDIVDKFKSVRVERILRVCLVMDRANALYNMIDGSTNARGMHWYSHKDKDVVDVWRFMHGVERTNGPTINKRITWLFELSALGLDAKTDLISLLMPCRTPLVAKGS